MTFNDISGKEIRRAFLKRFILFFYNILEKKYYVKYERENFIDH